MPSVHRVALVFLMVAMLCVNARPAGADAAELAPQPSAAAASPTPDDRPPKWRRGMQWLDPDHANEIADEFNTADDLVTALAAPGLISVTLDTRHACQWASAMKGASSRISLNLYSMEAFRDLAPTEADLACVAAIDPSGLDLNTLRITATQWENLAKNLPHLEALAVPQHFAYRAMNTLTFLPHLESLDLEGAEDSVYTLSNLRFAPQLRALYTPWYLTDARLDAIPTLARLHTLHSGLFATFGDDALARLTRFRELRVLDVSATQRVTAVGLPKLTALPHLRSLDIPPNIAPAGCTALLANGVNIRQECKLTPPDPEDLAPPSSALMIGLNLGGTIHGGTAGVVVGGEASYVWLNHHIWRGFYGDALYDTSHERMRFSAGGELGYSILGIDAGALLEISPVPLVGARIRPLLTFGLVSAYFGLDVFPRTGNGIRTEGEIGILVKLPVVRKQGYRDIFDEALHGLMPNCRAGSPIHYARGNAPLLRATQ